MFLGELSTLFKGKTGLRQSDVLAPVLFKLTIEKVIRTLPDFKEMELIGSYTLLAYADERSGRVYRKR